MPPAAHKSSPHPFYTAVVLAAGQARRMGAPKLLLPLEGRPLLQHVLEAAEASCLSELVLVVGPELNDRLSELPHAAGKPRIVIRNPRPGDGQSRSLALGLKAASPKAVAAAIVLGDEPRLAADRIDCVAHAFAATAKPCARPVYCSPPEPPVPGHPVFVARRLWPEIDQLRGDQGLRDLLTRRPEWLFEAETLDRAPKDIDTWKDYEAAGGERPVPN